MKISNFMNGRLTKEFDKVYPEILKTRALIIDIRSNHGGSSVNADYIAKHFYADSLLTGAWESRQYIPAFAWYCWLIVAHSRLLRTLYL